MIRTESTSPRPIHVLKTVLLFNFQGNMMVQDDVQTVQLASGLNVDLSATGTLSFDSSGQVNYGHTKVSIVRRFL